MRADAAPAASSAPRRKTETSVSLYRMRVLTVASACYRRVLVM